MRNEPMTLPETPVPDPLRSQTAGSAPPDAEAAGSAPPLAAVSMPRAASITLIDERALVARYAPMAEMQTRRAIRIRNEAESGDWRTLQRYRVNDWHMSQFARSMAVMYNAGIPLSRAFEISSASSESVEWSLIMAAVNRQIQSGKNPVEAFSAFPNIFGPTWAALLRRGMENGSLGDSFNALAQMHDRNAELRAKVQAASTYPIVIFAVCVIIAFIACVFVLPTLLESITSSGQPIPLITKLLIAICDLATNPVFLVCAGVAIVVNVRLFKQFISTYRGRLRFDMMAIRVPLIGRIVRLVAITKMLHTLQASLKAGTRVTLALDLAGAACGNAIYRLHMMRCIEGLTDGASLSSMFKPPNRLYEPLVYYAIFMGEESGTLDSLIGSVAAYYDVEVRSTLDNALTILEPLLVAGMGLVVGFVLLAIFLPLYGMMQAGS